MKKLLSVVIPAYNEEAMIDITASTISNILTEASIPFELIFVNDGSIDHTWKKILALSETDSHIHGVCFSRNFGKEAAIFAGMCHANGDCCVMIDCDLQHPPRKIVEMYRLWEDGFEIVEAVKSNRGKESPFHAFAAHTFYHIISKCVGIDMSRASDFKLLDRKAMLVLMNMQEKHAFFRALSSWIGFKTAQIEFDVEERQAGESKWSTRSLIKYAISNISSFSSAPLQLVTIMGIIMFAFSIVLGISTLYDKIRGVAPYGFTTVIIVQLFSGSLIMISLGIIGYYISKIYEEVKGRPRFIISETCGKIQSNLLEE